MQPVTGSLKPGASLADIITTAPFRALRPLVVDDPHDEVLIAERPGADTGVFVFTGLGHQLGLPLTLFDRYLAALGATAFYLKDFRHLSALGGIRALGEGYTATLAALHEMANERRIKRVCTIGHSSGARPAIRYGVDLDADCVIAVSGAFGRQPCLTDTPLNRRMLRRFTDRLSIDELDLAQFLRHRSYPSNIELLYDAESGSERANALYLSGLARVRLHPVVQRPRVSILHKLAIEGILIELLANLLGVDTASLSA
jgi:hypothetical protein